VFLPYLAGERSPVWDSMARGAWIGMTLATTSADLARAVLEGSAYGLRQLIELEVATSGDPMPELLSVGGGANSAVWSTIKADITGRTLHRATDVDASVRGAAMLAAVACGARADPVAAVRACRPLQTHTVVPTADEVTRDTYDRFYGVYTDLYPALRPFFPRLHGIESDLRTNPEMAPRLAEIAPA
jgi:xylulokinase